MMPVRSPRLPNMERRFIPWMNHGGFRARFSVSSTLYLTALPRTLLQSILLLSSAKVSLIHHVSEESESDPCILPLHLKS